MPVYPISFSISSKKIVQCLPEKTKILAPLIPGDTKTYIYKTEEQYYRMYQESCFAITMKKGGWDCLRHYEIIANGCLPVFLDIQQCPPNIMTKFPKQLLEEINEFYFQCIESKASIDELTEEQQERILSYTARLCEHLHKELTNKAMAQYVIDVVRPNDTVPLQKILVLSGCIHPDYLRCNMLSGFKELFGANCHDYPQIPHIYDNYATPERCYGRGFSYSKLFQEDKFRNKDLDESIINDIQNHVYDLIIYGSYHHGMPLWEHVNTFYRPEEIVMFCGEDTHTCNYAEYSNKGYHVFVRELI